MNVLVFGLSSLRGGVESVILNFCTEALENSICEFDFVVIDEIPEFARYLEEYGCRFFVVPNRMRDHFGYKRELKNIVRSGQYDLVWYNVCTLSDITLLKVAKAEGLTTVLHAHNAENMGGRLVGLLHDLHKKQIDRFVDQYIACSIEAAEFAFPGMIVQDQDAWLLVNNALPLDRLGFDERIRSTIRQAYDLDGSIVVGHIGRFHPQKNHEKIVSVFDALYRRNPETKLVLIGGGSLEGQVKQEIEDRGLSDAVLIIGQTEKVGEWLSAFDVFLFPSRYEGLGIALLEAQASGLPCLISDNIPQTAICSDNVRKIELDASDDIWAQQIEQLLSENPNFNRMLGVDLVRRAGYDLAIETPKFFRKLSLIADKD